MQNYTACKELTLVSLLSSQFNCKIPQNSMDPDQLKKPAGLDLHCFQNRIYLGSIGQEQFSMTQS